MKYRFTALLVVLMLFCFTNISEGSEKYRFGYIKGLQITIAPESEEFVAGSIATFTITLKNKSRDAIDINYPTGQQWDLVIYDTARQIFRWSNGFTWHQAPHSISLRPGEEKSTKLSWVSVNRDGQPLCQGIYRCVGLVTSSPRLVSNDVKFKLTPPSIVKKEIIKTSLNQCFELELPRYAKTTELEWIIVYKHNDNRIDARRRRISQNTISISFMPKRLGHVEFDLYAYPQGLNKTVSLERRSYRIEVE